MGCGFQADYTQISAHNTHGFQRGIRVYLAPKSVCILHSVNLALQIPEILYLATYRISRDGSISKGQNSLGQTSPHRTRYVESGDRST